MIVTSSGIVVVVMKSMEDILGDVVFFCFFFKICVDHSVKSASFQLYNSLFLGNDR